MADHTVVMYLGKIVERAPTAALFADVRHPYTRALFSAVLVAGPGGQDGGDRARGEVPSPLNPPSGCRFHTRCPCVMPRCSQRTEPALLREVAFAPAHRCADAFFDMLLWNKVALSCALVETTQLYDSRQRGRFDECA